MLRKACISAWPSAISVLQFETHETPSSNYILQSHLANAYYLHPCLAEAC